MYESSWVEFSLLTYFLLWAGALRAENTKYKLQCVLFYVYQGACQDYSRPILYV